MARERTAPDPYASLSLVHELLDVPGADGPILTFSERGDSFTRRDLRERSEAMANVLASAGVSHGDRVAVMAANCIEYIDIIFACSRLGAIVVHLHTAAKGPMLKRALGLTEPRCVIASTTDSGRFDEDLDHLELLPLEDLAQRMQSAPPRPLRESGAVWSDPICIYSSSGTTGNAKSVTLPHRALFKMAETAQVVMGFDHTDVAYTVTPLYHANAFVVMFMAVTLAGAHTILAERFSVSSFWSDIERYSATKTSLVGSAATLLLKQSDGQPSADTTLTLVAAAPRPREAEEFERRFNVTLTEFYGSTEANLPLGIPLGERRPGSCGRLLEGWECKIVDERGQDVQEAVGELLVRPKSPGTIAMGYWGEPEKTVDLWRDLWVHTGDLLRRDRDGWFYFVDRLKDAIRVSGENVASADIEVVVEAYEDVLEVAAFGVPSELGEQDIMVGVVTRHGSVIDWASLRDHCHRSLPYFAVPRYFERFAAFPRTPTERIKKSELRARGITATTVDLGRTRRAQ